MVDPDVTHAKLTPTVEDTGKATVQVGRRGATLAAVTSRSASGAIALNMGANEIIVRVTAENGVTKDYTIAISVGAPDVPTGLVVTPRPLTLELTWTAPGVPVTDYDVHYTTVAVKGVVVQGKCPVKCSAKMSLRYAAMVSDVCGLGTIRCFRLGGPPASR